MSTQPKDLRGLAVLLGIGGLVPFIALAWLCLRDASGSSEYQHSLVVYAACITSFVGAVHWGLVLGEVNTTRRHALQLAWSVVPSLAAWGVTTSSEPRTALARMALVLAVCWLTDAVFSRWGPIPAWYFRLRSLLTVVAVASLMLTGLASSG